jgi:hypothetical protein
LIAIKFRVDFRQRCDLEKRRLEGDYHGIRSSKPPARSGPSRPRSLVPGNPPHGPMKQLLSPQERARLAVIASVVRFKKGDAIYRQGAPADAVYNIMTGVAKAYKTAADGPEHVVAFLFPEDRFGLAQEGVYENSTGAYDDDRVSHTDGGVAQQAAHRRQS